MRQTHIERTPSLERLSQIMGCKWSMGILEAIARGVTRPSRIERELDGISTKVLHRCMNRLEAEGFLTKTAFDEIPPHVEYGFSEKGVLLIELIRHARELSEKWTELTPMSLD